MTNPLIFSNANMTSSGQRKIMLHAVKNKAQVYYPCASKQDCKLCSHSHMSYDINYSTTGHYYLYSDDLGLWVSRIQIPTPNFMIYFLKKLLLLKLKTLNYAKRITQSNFEAGLKQLGLNKPWLKNNCRLARTC